MTSESVSGDQPNQPTENQPATGQPNELPTGQPATGQPATGQPTGQPATGEESGKTKEGETWRDRITDKQLKTFSERFTTEEELAKAAFQFRQQLSNAITLPGKGATEEDIKEFRKKLGVPDTHDDYKIDFPDDLLTYVDAEEGKNTVNQIKEILHKAGATKDVAENIGGQLLDVIKNAYISDEEEKEREIKTHFEDAERNLKKEWGGDYEINIRYADRAIKQFGDDEFMRLLDAAKIDGISAGNHPAFSRVFATIGRQMGEAGLHAVMSDGDKQTTEKKIDELTHQAHTAMDKNDRITADRLFKERDALAKQFYG